VWPNQLSEIYWTGKKKGMWERNGCGAVDEAWYPTGTTSPARAECWSTSL
jgi:hypothetical protein